MRCPHCGHNESKVLDTREAEHGIRRRRECLRCGARFSTLERVQAAAVMVVKRNGVVEEFNRDKLLAGIRTASAKRPLPAGAVEKVVDDIEEELTKRGRSEVTSRQVGEMVMERLRKLDRVAYIRFASVYRDFADEEDFRNAVESLQRESGSGASQGQLALLPPDTSGTRRRGRPPKR
jgi:transcriptional repressor NrdR